MSSNPTTWVNLCEAVFASHGVTDLNDKYNLMVVVLPVQVLRKVKEIINAPLDTDNWMFMSPFFSKLLTSVHLQCTAKDLYNKRVINIMDVAACADKCVEESSTPSLPAYSVSEIDT